MGEIWLDKEQKFLNHHTGDVNGSDIFDIRKASNSYAQESLNGSKHEYEVENRMSHIVEMTPMEYFETCARDCFDEPVHTLIQGRRADKNVLEHLKQVILKYGKKFPIPYIDYAQFNKPGQEGLHRMMVAGDLFGWDTKFPVQIIEWADKDKAMIEKDNRFTTKIESYIRKAITNALRYKYYNIAELKDQLQSELEDEFRYVEGFENGNFTFDLQNIDNETFVVIVNNKFKWEFSTDEVQWRDTTEDSDLEDIELDDLSDWMKDFLNDLEANKKESLTERYALPNEFLVSDQLQDLLKAEFGKDYYNKPICKDVCDFVHKQCPEAEVLSFLVSVWKIEPTFYESISQRGHCVIRYKDKVYDYTSGQYDDYGFKAATSQPRVLSYNPYLSKKFTVDAYVDQDYVVASYV